MHSFLNSKRIFPSSSTNCGFSLLELLIVLAAISSVAAIGFVQMNNTTASVKSVKLRQDVAALNRAVRTYMMSGGDLSTIRSGGEVIAKLKSTSSASQHHKIAGLRGTMVDLRLRPVLAAADDSLRAVWDDTQKTFLLQNSGDGFQEFLLDGTPPPSSAEEQRNLVLAMDKTDKWIWNFSDNSGSKSGARTPSSSYTTPITAPASAASMIVLQAPDFSKPAGTYKFSEYSPHLDVSLVQKHAANVEDLYYSIANGPWTRWSGGSLPIERDVKTEVRAYSAPLDPDRYEQSATSSAVYETKARLQPLLKLDNLLAAYTYADVGGSFITGLTPPPAPQPGPIVALANASEIPLNQQNSNFFEARWTMDGTDPSTSPRASVSGSFSNGFPGQQVSINYNQWGTRSTLPLQVISKALQLDDFKDSPVLAPAITAARTVLPPPVIMETMPLNGVRQLSISADITNGKIPPGTRLYYTTDGTIPGIVGDNNGLDNASAGLLYTGPIAIPSSGDDDMIVTARLYPPVNMPQWFSASEVESQDVPVGLGGGHIDVDTSSMLYPFRRGSTDGHVHAYDKKYNVTGASFFNFASSNLRNIQQVVPAGSKFKIIVSNPDLSSGGRLIINEAYDPSNPRSWNKVKTYSNTPVRDLPVYSLEGLPGTTRLSEFGLYFDLTAISGGEIIPTSTGQVRSNVPGRLGEWRNGALTIQVVKVNADGSDAFTTNQAYSSGGKQGVATSGLIWETTFFHHSKAGAYAN